MLLLFSLLLSVVIVETNDKEEDFLPIACDPRTHQKAKAENEQRSFLFLDVAVVLDDDELIMTKPITRTKVMKKSKY